MVETEWAREPTPRQLERLRELVRAVGESDGHPEIAQDGSLPGEYSDGEHLFATDDADGRLVGYAHLDTVGDAFGRKIGELIVHPAHRRAGVGGRLLAQLAERVGVVEGEQGDRLRVWSHGDDPAAARLASRHGFAKVRELDRMVLDLDAVLLPEPEWPEGVSVRTFRPGVDERAVVEVNAAAFDWHPEQSALTVDELTRTEREPWFDPEGFFLAEEAGRLIGFHWTKMHDARDGRQPVGEVYVVGVRPDAQGGGLGKALTLAGLRYLGARGLQAVMLYVESDNPAAIAVYRKLGFAFADAGVQYAR